MTKNRRDEIEAVCEKSCIGISALLSMAWFAWQQALVLVQVNHSNIP